MSSKTIFNFVAVIAIIVVVYFGYKYFTGSDATPDTTGSGSSVIVVGAPGVATSSSPADEFRQLLASISNVDFQGDHPIFTDRIFTLSLEDFSQPLPFIDTSRDNPFAPLGKDAINAHHSATTSLNFSTGSAASRTASSTANKRPTLTASPRTTSAPFNRLPQ